MVETYRNKMNDESFHTYIDELGLNLVRTKRVKTSLLVIGAEKDTATFESWLKHCPRIRHESEIFPDMALTSCWKQVGNRVAKRILEWLEVKRTVK